MMLLDSLAYLVFFLIYILFGCMVATIAENKGHNGILWFVIGLIALPIALVASILLKENGKAGQSSQKTPFSKLVRSMSKIESKEVEAGVLSFIFIFTLMAAYYLVRPVRDAMASDWTDTEVSWLWTLNFFISTALVAVWGFAITRIPFNRLVTSIYSFFAASFVLFFVFVQFAGDSVLVDKTFYVWVSVFALFNTSIFWSFMSDVFAKEQAKRLFAFIATGASAGAIAGPLLTGTIANDVGIDSLMLMSAVMLLVPIPMIVYLRKLKETDLGNADNAVETERLKLGGNPFNGFVSFFTNPYLLAMGAFLLLYTGVGSFVYFLQKNLLEPLAIEDRTALYGYRDSLVNTLTYILAFFATSRVVTRLGMPTALAAVPVVLIFGMAILSFSPVMLAAVAMHVTLRAGNYGMTRPAREMLYTTLSREDRFKAKPVIDVFVYRGGDVVMGWFFTFLSEGLNLALAAIAAIGALISAFWSVMGVFLGRQFNGIRDKQEAAQSNQDVNEQRPA